MSRNFPSWLNAYMQYSEQSEAPELFNFWTGVSVIAGALRRHVWIDMLRFQWTPNFYIFFVAPPGIATKTTTIDAGHSLLAEVDGVTFGAQSTTWQALIADMEAAVQVFETPASPSGFMQMSALTVVVGELGTFLKPKDTDLIDNLVSMWDGRIGTHKHSTKTTGKNAVVNPWINVIGCTTPGWMRSNFPQYMIDGGLTSRTIFLFADRKRQLIAYPNRKTQPTAFLEMRQRLIEDLRKIADMKGPYQLSEAAYAWGEEWYQRHWTGRHRAVLSDRYQGYLARKQTHIHKLAIIFAASESDTLLITEDHLSRAERVVSGLEVDMQKIFDSIGLSDTGRLASEIVSTMQVYKELAYKDLLRMFMTRVDRKDLDAALENLKQVGTLESIVLMEPTGAASLGYRLTAQGLGEEIVESLGNKPWTSEATP